MRTRPNQPRGRGPMTAILVLMLSACGGGGSSDGDTTPRASVPTPTPTSIPTPSPSPVPTATPSPTPAPSPTPTPAPSPSPSPSPSPTPAPSPTPTPTPIEYDWSALSDALDATVGSRSDQVAGYSFALNVAGGNSYARSGGNLSQNSWIAIASATKAASATAILALADAGLIDLDTPVATYIGAVVDWPADKASITTRMLLNHTSGLPFDSPCLEDFSTTIAACVQEIAGADLNFTPGSAFSYSGAGYQVAGLVAEQAAGQSWSALFNQRIVTPLGLGLFTYGATQNPRIAGGAVTTAQDYLRLLQLFLDGGIANGSRVLSDTTIAAVQTNQVAGLFQYFSPSPRNAGLNDYSFGWWISDAANHPGSIGPELSDPGVFGALPWMDFDRRYAAVLLIESDMAHGLAIWSDIRDLILQQIETHGLPEAIR